ncbi:MAG: DUF5301 domain-containing protein [Gracilibacteraceae bacterium]|nr:DUF5301 domain-containing protein [Gracilibacteraceae bacterium]
MGDGNRTVFLYSDGSKNYIEEPYVAIYSVSGNVAAFYDIYDAAENQ